MHAASTLATPIAALGAAPETVPMAAAGCLLEIIELKWLLAGHGMRIHVEHLLHDAEYARHTLDCAALTANPALREVAARLRLQLGLQPS